MINKIIDKVRFQFSHKWIWRLYIVTQLSSLIFLIRLDISNHYGWDFFFDFFELRQWRYWSFGNYNEVALLSLVGPFIIIKVLNWILDSRD